MAETTMTEVVHFGPLNDLLQSIAESDSTPFSLPDKTLTAMANMPLYEAIAMASFKPLERPTKRRKQTMRNTSRETSEKAKSTTAAPARLEQVVSTHPTVEQRTRCRAATVAAMRPKLDLQNFML